MVNIYKKIQSFPQSPGVYIFRDKSNGILYVGKATSLRDRVKSYFQRANDYERPIDYFREDISDIEIRLTDTVLEAFILEQDLIKKINPKHNVMGKDDKSFTYVVVTKEDFPTFLVLRKTELNQVSNFQFPMTKFEISNSFKIKNLEFKIDSIYGPYTSKYLIETVLKILRKIFPYHKKPHMTEKGCLDYQIGLCPGPYDGAISKVDYKKNIRSIQMILEGKKTSLIDKMKKEMQDCSRKEDYERAAGLRNQIFALQHIQDIALVTKEKSCLNHLLGKKSGQMRIEAYDISNISGKYAVGSMVVFDNMDGRIKPDKSQYRKFKIKTVEGVNDVAAMEEVLKRRFHNNWPKPNLLILDGGAGHLNMARRVLRIFHYDIPLLAVAKGPKRRKLDLRSFGRIPELSRNILEQIRDEAHRFAITYHRKLRDKNILT